MSVVESSSSLKKRKRGNSEPKLVVGQRVEVRSDEEGFVGSWHPGTVVTVTRLHRHVEYDHLLKNDESSKLVETVRVSSAIDGSTNFNPKYCKNRGNIRPTPPPFNFRNVSLSYALCVDVCYNGAWWEGVIFDRNDQADKRRVYFPDLGDEMLVEVDLIRVTQDWDECKETWEQRGVWMFLELLDEYMVDAYIPISIRQIWYDLREMDELFTIKEWTCSDRSIWEPLLRDVISENIKIFVDHSAKKVLDSYSEERDMSPDSEVVKAVNNVVGSGTDAIIPVDTLENVSADNLSEESEHNQLIESVSENLKPINEADDQVPQPLAVLPSLKSGSSDIVASNSADSEGLVEIQQSSVPSKCLSLKHEKSSRWSPISQPAKFYPKAITKYVEARNKTTQRKYAKRAKKHLAYLKWTFEIAKDESCTRKRYRTPDGDCYDSLVRACQYVNSSIAKSEERSLSVAPDVSHTSSDGKLVTSHVSSTSSNRKLVVQPENNPQAVVKWLEHGRDESKKSGNYRCLCLQARKHMAYLGCEFRYKVSGNFKRLYTYSRDGKCYYSLRQACKAYLAGKMAVNDVPEVEPCLSEQLRVLKKKRRDVSSRLPHMQASSENAGVTENNLESTITSFGDKSACQSGGHATGKRILRFTISRSHKETPHLRRNNSCQLLRLQANSGKEDNTSVAPTTSGNKKAVSHPSSCAPRTRKANSGKEDNTSVAPTTSVNKTEVSHPSSCAPRTRKAVRQLETSSVSSEEAVSVLSWLMDEMILERKTRVAYRSDENMILGRARVSNRSRRALARSSYRRRRALPSSLEGLVTREGIKCDCCKKIWSLDEFETHAGYSTSTPATNIFLRGGRSLFDCELEALRKYSKRVVKGQKHKLHCSESDHDEICSFCRYGGELLLCDRCPATYHTSCLGIKEIPEGDWFCPSCHCRFCNKEFKDGEEIILRCHQCSRKYHDICMSERGGILSHHATERVWFCDEKCQKIFRGLQRLVGVKNETSEDNVTWTLIQPRPQDRHDPSTAEALIKLNIALSVLHECFEKLYEVRTGGDIAEDVMFNSRSNLSRIDYRGFYTVLLQKNEELVTVATLRVFEDRVAEIPFVGTRFRHRRKGMCSILMNELEMNLKKLGVERLILPAIPSVLKTWTGSFGFSPMSEDDKLQLTDLPILNFEDTIMCQKLLLENPSSTLTQLEEPNDQIQGNFAATQ